MAFAVAYQHTDAECLQPYKKQQHSKAADKEKNVTHYNNLKFQIFKFQIPKEENNVVIFLEFGI